MATLERLRLEARKYSRKVPVPPIQFVVDRDYLVLHSLLNTGERGLTVRQNTLDAALREGRTMRVSPGIRTKVVYWEGIYGVVAGFNHEGIQVGYGQALWYPDPEKREKARQMMPYQTAYVVSSEFERQGLGFSMMVHLEDFIAFNNTGVGASFIYDVQAEIVERQAAAARMIEKIKARPYHPSAYYIRIALKPQYFRGGELGLTKAPNYVPIDLKY